MAKGTTMTDDEEYTYAMRPEDLNGINFSHIATLALVDEVILQNPWRMRAMVAHVLGYTELERVCEADHQAMLNGFVDPPQYGLPPYMQRAWGRAQVDPKRKARR